jgi:nuclear pore complex protein Nup205
MDDSLEAFEALHRSLEALRDNRLPAIDRLAAELDARLEEFKTLLDHKRKNDASRRKLSDGIVRLSIRRAN